MPAGTYSMIKGVIFDLDGTLISERAYVTGCLEHVGRYIERIYGTRGAFFDLKLLFEEKWSNLFDRYFEKMQIAYGDEDIKTLVAVYRETAPVVRLYPGAKEVLSGLKNRGVRTALLTNGHYEVQKKKIEAAGLGAYFDVVIIPDQAGRECWKPSPWGYEQILSAFCIPAEETAAIGNADIDFVAPSDLGMKKIYIEHEDRIAGLSADRSIDKKIRSLRELAL